MIFGIVEILDMSNDRDVPPTTTIYEVRVEDMIGVDSKADTDEDQLGL